MTAHQLAEKLKETFGDEIVDVSAPDSGSLYITVTPESLKNITKHTFHEEGLRYVVNAGTDRRPTTGSYMVTHFFSDDAGLYVGVHTNVEPDCPQVDSVTPHIPAANWTEREARDMVGIEPMGHPDPRRLVLSDDWPEDLFPLRHDVEHGDKPPLSDEPCEPVPRKDAPEGSSVVPVGPYFPALEEPAYFRLFVEGETVTGADYRGFYNHRGIEKMGCSVLTYNKIPFIAERICGICGCVHSTSYCQAAEKAAGIKIPERAKFIRTIMLELERLESHMLWLGIAGHIIGFDTVLMQTWRMREPLMWLCERISGNRKTYGMNIIGGVRRDIKEEHYDDIRRVIGDIEDEWQELYNAIPGDATLMARLKNTGILTEEVARDHAVVGPTARGSGIDIDVRVDHPYAAYDQIEVNKCVYDGCDNLARTLVRIDETLESVKIIREALEKMPDGPIRVDIEQDIPVGQQGLSAVEAPRGEVFHWVLTGAENKPERWRVRAPSYQNLQAVPPMLVGSQLADVPIEIGSFDPCFSCTDRMEVVDANTGTLRVCTREEILQRQ
ncbi:MAG: NADH-quinone oxidoreductase subunit C [Armatimonadota bacterium]